jgi:hypothetical protein
LNAQPRRLAPKAWAPQIGPQADAIRLRRTPELLFGGARGGGKSDYLLGDFCQDVGQGAAWRGVIFRRTYPELEQLIARAQTLIPQTWPGAEWLKGDKTWNLPTSSTLRMRSLETADDVSRYLGHEYSWIGFDELGAFPDDRPYRQLMACLRSSEPVEAMRIRATANPGGSGHAWIRARFVDPDPKGYMPITDAETGMVRVFIPSRVTDNAILLSRDPGYIDRLRGVGSPELVRSWLEGDWNAVVGAYFSEFGERHIRRPFEIPRNWLRLASFDWGSARPFGVLWCAMSDGTVTNVPRNAMVVYREIYGASAPNVGLRMTAEQVADMIREYEMFDLEPVAYRVADPAIFAADGGPSIAERMAMRAVRFKPADNTRVGRLGALGGWDLVRQRLVGEDGSPMLLIFNTCTNLIRTLPTLQHDAKRPEDLDSNGDDHLADCLRYAVSSRPWVKAEPEVQRGVTMNMLWAERERRMWH